MKSTLVIFASILAMASATAINSEKPEERTFIGTTINSNNFLALNSTLLVAVIGVLVFLALAALIASGGFSAAKIAQRYGNEYDQFYQTAEEAFSQTRYRRSAGNGKAEFLFLNSISSLKLLFKKSIVYLVGFCFDMMIYILIGSTTNWIDRDELYFPINSKKNRVCKKHD